MTKKITFSLLAIIISGCLLISVGLMVGVFYLLKSQKNYAAPTVAATEMPSVDAQMDQIQEQVTALRGLEMNAPLERAMMTSAELQDAVENDFFKDYTAQDAQYDTDLLSAIGLLNPDFELLQFYKDLYSEQIAGYYDSETKEMNVISDAGFGGLERMTYAHEFTHVLQDQNYDLENGLKLNDENCELESEYCAAVAALIEGDATLTEQYWFLKDSTDQDKTDVSDFQMSYQSPVYDSAPEFMKQDFLFPYEKGFAFVNRLYGENKWASIDEAFQDPPVSTEQILHPEKYPDEKPITVEMPDLTKVLGDGWMEYDRDVMGEWYSYLILSAGIDSYPRLGTAQAETATAGWGGDTFVYYINESSNDFVFAWRSAWESANDTEEFFSSCRDYGNLRWESTRTDGKERISWNLDTGGIISIQKSGSDVLWIMSNDFRAYNKAFSSLESLEG